MKGDMESLHHHFKLFTEGFCIPEGECTPASSTRRASSASTGLGRRQQAVPHEDPRAGLSRTCRRWTEWRAATCWPTLCDHRHQDIVFGEIDGKSS